MKFRILTDTAISDAAFEAFGKTENELFENAALAVFSQMARISKVPKKIEKKILVRAKQFDLLLYNFLAELIALKDTEEMVFSRINPRIQKEKNGWTCSATVWGEKAETLSSKIIRRDVKAVTFHLFKIEKTAKGLKATVVLDL